MSRSYDQRALVERIERGLLMRKWSARELCRQSKLSETMVAQFMRRARLPRSETCLSLQSLYAIARALDVSFSWLCSGEGASQMFYTQQMAPAVRAAMTFALTTGMTEEQVQDWYGMTPAANEMAAEEIWKQLQLHRERWAFDRQRHKGPDARDVSLLDIRGRWPIRWPRAVFEMAEKSLPHPTTWVAWQQRMDSLERIQTSEGTDTTKKGVKRLSRPSRIKKAAG